MSGATIFLVILLLILLALAITFLVLWLINRNKKKENNPVDLAITGLDVRLSNATTVTATWTGTGSAASQVALYVDTQRINFDAAGKPVKASANILTGGPVSAASQTVSVSGLKPDTKYYVDVVVTGDNRANVEPFKFWTGGVPVPEFVIQDLDAAGGIELGSDNTTVTHQSKLANKNNDDLWFYNTETFQLLGNGTSGNANPVLYNNNGTLAATTTAATLTPANSQWVYNVGGKNRWCLRGSPDVCLKVDDISTNSSPIRVVSGGDSQWLNKTLLLDFLPQ